MKERGGSDYWLVPASLSTWVLEMHNGADSRLTSAFIGTALLPALDVVERDWRAVWRASRETKDKNAGGGSLIIVGNRAQHKFFSNGGHPGRYGHCLTDSGPSIRA